MDKPTLGPQPLDCNTEFDTLTTVVEVGSIFSRLNGVVAGADIEVDIDSINDWGGIEGRTVDGED